MSNNLRKEWYFVCDSNQEYLDFISLAKQYGYKWIYSENFHREDSIKVDPNFKLLSLRFRSRAYENLYAINLQEAKFLFDHPEQIPLETEPDTQLQVVVRFNEEPVKLPLVLFQYTSARSNGEKKWRHIAVVNHHRAEEYKPADKSYVEGYDIDDEWKFKKFLYDRMSDSVIFDGFIEKPSGI